MLTDQQYHGCRDNTTGQCHLCTSSFKGGSVQYVARDSPLFWLIKYASIVATGSNDFLIRKNYFRYGSKRHANYSSTHNQRKNRICLQRVKVNYNPCPVGKYRLQGSTCCNRDNKFPCNRPVLKLHSKAANWHCPNQHIVVKLQVLQRQHVDE